MDLLQNIRFSLHKILTDVLESCGSLVDYCDAFNQLFKLSVWRHPFTAEDQLVDLFWNSSTICMNSGWVNSVNFQMSAYVNKTLYKRHHSLKNRITLLFTYSTVVPRRSMIPGESDPSEFPFIPMAVWIPASEIPSFQPNITYFLIWTPYILDENIRDCVFHLMKLDSYSSKLQNGHKPP